MKSQLFSVWEGVYDSFKEADGDLDAFDSSLWLNKQKERINIALEDYKQNNFVSKDYPLSIIVAMLLSFSKNSISILDFGGGMGLQYLDMIAKIPESENKIDYYVIDGKASIDNRPDEINQFKKLYFLSDVNNVNKKIDIIHIGNTLQYIEDWKNLLLTLNNKFKPKYFVFSALLVGDIQTFVSHQIFYDKNIPVTMLNMNEFKNVLQELFFENIYQTYFQVPILGYNELPNFALPENFRLKHSYNMIFRKYI